MSVLLKDKRLKSVIFAVIVIAAIYGCYASTHPSGSFRYKMTVEVETPEGLKTGSAVREVQMRTGPGFLGVEKRGYARVLGEAVVVDLGKRGVLFALLGEDYAYQIAFDALGWRSGGLTPEGIRHFSGLKVGTTILEPGPSRNPVLATFSNLKDPKSVKRIMPDDLMSYFGKGVVLKKITLEITDEPITHAVDRYLPSFGKETGFIEWFQKLSYGDSHRIGPNEFK